MAQSLTSLPDVIDAGTTVKFTSNFTDYPSSLWSAKLYFAGVGDDAGGVSGVPNGNGFDFTLTSTASAAVLPGPYVWQVLVTRIGSNPAEVYLADEGRVQVRPNIATATAGSLLSYEEQAIPIIQAAIKGILTDAMKGFQVQTASGAYSVETLSLSDLQRELKRCQAVIAQANQGRGQLGLQALAHFPGADAE